MLAIALIFKLHVCCSSEKKAIKQTVSIISRPDSSTAGLIMMKIKEVFCGSF